MFFSEAILSRKGSLAKVWLAAHWERKLTKSQLLQTDITNSVRKVQEEEEQGRMALRLSGQLLLGVARIYSRKTKYLMEDCGEASVRIRLAFHAASLPRDTSSLDLTQAQQGFRSQHLHSITLSDQMNGLDLTLADEGLGFG
ncbi:Rec8 like protein-domain-containing protein [Piptocephalis cylindrospora]|uniref:Rec8 like protein-domain-containing protein n=1 Tax=Piptocephalis cylindrospora TaxID=1907219 RepID=A0A4P9Y5C8_9FUNG|nr:Rec8 like protein-domain-containing protein [Piptocephalis cylindrospora]|eukprot:RKP13912.1 Rec8 like protein-domain-containing protein [Piptocephalis cylindrospora]